METTNGTEWRLEVEELTFTGCMCNHVGQPGFPFSLNQK